MTTRVAVPSSVASGNHLGYVPALDGLRGLAVLLVMGSHIQVPHLHLPFATGGFVGVDLFFVLSGYLITSLLLAEHEASGKINLGHFYLRRALRLLPALFVFLAVWSLIVPGNWPLYALTYSINWAFALGTLPSGPVSHLWSLAVEGQFYVVWPALLLLALLLRLPHAAIVVATGALAIASVLAQTATSLAGASTLRLYDGTDFRAVALFLGCIVGMVTTWQMLHDSPAVRRLLRLGTVVALALIAFVVATANIADPYLYRGGLPLVDAAASILLLRLSQGPSRLLAFLRFRPLVAVGRISYGVYLWQHPLAWLVSPLPVLLAFPLAVCLPFLAAGLSYHYVEAPALRLKRRYSAAT